ncbi:MAG: AzlD domain-containing protein [Coriobacteriia bacterium]|nr:AzlD domain-containing protein [Coriobacteriia bacterium]
MSELAPTLIWVVIVGMAATNFTLRFVPMAVLSRVTLPAPVMRWLGFIPVSVMGALFAQVILLPSFEAAPNVPLYLNPGIFGGLGAMLVFRLTRSFMIASLAGMGVYVLVRWLVGV